MSVCTCIKDPEITCIAHPDQGRRRAMGDPYYENKIAELESKVESLEQRNKDNQVLVDCIPILIGGLKSSKKSRHMVLVEWDRSRAALEGGE